ncbi:MAG: PEP-CTERM sorting domain-containing protein [Pirellulales bacterium]|nr:PEP-CTERM sorting domain-containing protein [Pirellulales bacterium]
MAIAPQLSAIEVLLSADLVATGQVRIVPEPSSMTLALLGFGALGGWLLARARRTGRAEP